jgi:hypothetical protein
MSPELQCPFLGAARFAAHIRFIFSERAFRPAALKPRFFVPFYLAFLPPDFFAAQYFRSRNLQRRRHSDESLSAAWCCTAAVPDRTAPFSTSPAIRTGGVLSRRPDRFANGAVSKPQVSYPWNHQNICAQTCLTLAIGGHVSEIDNIISQLERQRTAIDNAIEALRGVSGASRPAAKRPGRSKGKKRSMSPEGRQRQIEAMRKYWAEKKAGGKASRRRRQRNAA